MGVLLEEKLLRATEMYVSVMPGSHFSKTLYDEERELSRTIMVDEMLSNQRNFQ